MVSLEWSWRPACHPQMRPEEQAQAASLSLSWEREYMLVASLSYKGPFPDGVESKSRLPAQSAPGIRSTSICVFMTLLSTEIQENQNLALTLWPQTSQAIFLLQFLSAENESTTHTSYSSKHCLLQDLFPSPHKRICHHHTQAART